MALVDRITAETRTIGGVPWTPWSNPYWKFNIGGPAHPGRQVTGAERVLGLSAVYACVRYIADAVASLPMKVYRTGPDGQPQLIRASAFLDQPGISGTAYDWLFTCMVSALLWGNAWGLITSRSGITSPGTDIGYPTSVEWLPPDRVSVQEDPDQPENPLRARIWYDGRLMNREDLVHVRAFPLPGRVEGVSPMRAFATLYMQGLAALDYSSEWFKNGGFPPGVFKNASEQIDESQSAEIRRMLTDVLRSRQPLVIGSDWDYTAIHVPPNEAVFISAMQLNATQVAAIYGLPAERAGGSRGNSLTYANVVQENLSLITDTLRPWLARLEALFSQLLPVTQYVKFDVDQLLKVDLKTRNEIWLQQRQMGTRTSDEIRAQDDLPPLPGGIGAEAIPQSVLERLAGSARAIPKSMLPSLALETDLAAELLQKLAPEGFTPPPDDSGQPPVPMNAEQYLGHQITVARGGGPDAPAPEWPDSHRDVRATGADRARALAHIRAAAAAGCIDETDQDRRLSQANVTGVTRGLLTGLTRDLPPETELYTSDDDGRPAPLPTFGPAAMAMLSARAIDMDIDAERRELASMNGHHQ